MSRQVHSFLTHWKTGMFYMTWYSYKPSHPSKHNKCLFTCTKIFWSNILLSRGVNSLPFSAVSGFSISGRSKNRYRHLTSVDGTDTEVITCNSTHTEPKIEMPKNKDNNITQAIPAITSISCLIHHFRSTDITQQSSPNTCNLCFFLTVVDMSIS
jgi:hypothetical protein